MFGILLNSAQFSQTYIKQKKSITIDLQLITSETITTIKIFAFSSLGKYMCSLKKWTKNDCSYDKPVSQKAFTQIHTVLLISHPECYIKALSELCLCIGLSIYLVQIK